MGGRLFHAYTSPVYIGYDSKTLITGGVLHIIDYICFNHPCGSDELQ